MSMTQLTPFRAIRSAAADAGPRRCLPVAALALFCAVALLPAQSSSQNAGQETAVKALVAKYAAAREAENPAEIETLFTDDADQLVSTGVWRHGRDELVQGMLASSRGNPGDRTITVERVRFVADGVAIADARYEIAQESGGPRRMWSTFLAVKTGDGWRIAAIRNMLPAQ